MIRLLLIILLSASSVTRKEAGDITPAIVVEDSVAVVGAPGHGEKTSLDILEELQEWQYREAARLRAEARERELRLWVVIGFLLAIIVSTVWYFITRKVLADKLLEEEKAENERLMSIAEDLQGRLRGRGVRDTGILERLCEQYYIYEGTANLQPKVLKEVKAVIDNLRNDSGELEKAADEGGLVTKLRAQVPRLKDEDVKLFCYLVSGFSATTISTLMEKDKQYIYNRVYRLRGRIAESDAPDKELFLAAIGK